MKKKRREVRRRRGRSGKKKMRAKAPTFFWEKPRFVLCVALPLAPGNPYWFFLVFSFFSSSSYTAGGFFFSHSLKCRKLIIYLSQPFYFLLLCLIYSNCICFYFKPTHLAYPWLSGTAQTRNVTVKSYHCHRS